MAYKVVSPSAVVKDEQGAQHIFYADALLPDGLDKDHVQHLLDLGFIEDDGAKKSSK